jgi:hypothetical protein
VRTLQRNLNTTVGAGLVVDGDFGSATRKALIAFQTRSHVEVDGEYGPQSAAAMKAALAGHMAPIEPKPCMPPAGPLAVDGVFGQLPARRFNVCSTATAEVSP